jgi:hypothetical protein
VTGVAAFVVATAGVVAGGVLGARLLRFVDALDWLLAVALLGCAQIVLVSIVIGAVFHRYETWTLVGSTLVCDVALLGAVLVLRPAAAGLAGGAAAARSVWAALGRWQRLVVVIAAVALLWRVVLAVLLPPFAYDALTYHLTAVASWIQSGRIGPNPFAPCCARYPADAEVLFAWPTVLLGRDTLTDAVQIGLAVLGALAVAGLARGAGVSRAGATTAAGLFAATPIVLAQANTNYNDIALTSMLLVALYFAYRLAACAASGTPAISFALLAGVAAGLALGTKTSGILFAAIMTALVGGHLVRAAVGARVLRGQAAAGAAAFAGSVLLLGGWWYGKNWIDEGNPVWPFQVHVLGRELFRGTATVNDYLTEPPDGNRFWLLQVGRSWYADLAFFLRGGYTYEERTGGLGPVWSWLGSPLLALGAVVAIRRRPSVVVNVLLPLALLFALLPYRWWSRFTIFLSALGVIAVVAVIEHLGPSLARRALVAATVVLAAAGAALATWRLDPAGHGRVLTAADVVGLALHPSRPRSLGSLFFPEYRWLDEVPRRATIGVELDAPSIRFPYALFGSRLERKVVLFEDGGTAHVDGRLRGPGPVYLAVEAGGAFDRWARRRPLEYTPFFSDRGVRVFRRAPGRMAA